MIIPTSNLRTEFFNNNNGKTIITIKKQVCLIDHNHIVSFLKTVFA